MDENSGIKKLTEIKETYPPTKLMWIPQGALGVQSRDREILATSSDFMHIYDMSKEVTEDGTVMKLERTILLRNESEFSNPISSFDWNRTDPSKIAVSSVDSTVTILDIK